jgi:hypothetical protein
VLTVTASLAALPLALSSASAVAHTTTTATIFKAFHPDGTPTLHAHTKSGSCFTGSLTIDRRDAWRCIVGNLLFDPCFSSAHAPGKVLCPNAQLNGGVEIKLTKGLPHAMGNPGAPSLKDQPWDIQLTQRPLLRALQRREQCRPGRASELLLRRGGQVRAVGLPAPEVPAWTILSAPFSAKHLHARVAIRRVWM